MAIEQLKKNVEIIQTLSDYPNTDQGLTPAELKKKFDDGNRIIKEYLNSTVVPAINQNGEKIQKREPLEVSIGVASASRTAGEILAARAAGRDVYGYLTGPEVEDTRLSLLSVTADCAIFSRFYNDHSCEKYLIDRGGAVEYYHERYALEDQVIKLKETIPTLADNAAQAAESATQAAEDAAKAGKALIVTIKNEVVNQVGRIVASHNSDQIYEHISNGGAAYLEKNGRYIPYDYSETYDGLRTVAFAYFAPIGFGEFYFVRSDGELHTGFIHVASADNVIESEKSLIDRLCPSFSESGGIVQCEPVEGYPLSVVTEESATTVSRCGKNMIDYTLAAPRNDTSVVNIIENGVEWAAGNHFFTVPCDVKAGNVVVFSCADEADAINGIILYDSKTKTECSSLVSKGKPTTANADADIARVYKREPTIQITTPIVVTNLQLEHGTVATAYEPHKGVETFVPGETVPALSGVNTIWADSGEITVTGKSDPVAIIEKLTNAVISFGGNI